MNLQKLRLGRNQRTIWSKTPPHAAVLQQAYRGRCNHLLPPRARRAPCFLGGLIPCGIGMTDSKFFQSTENIRTEQRVYQRDQRRSTIKIHTSPVHSAIANQKCDGENIPFTMANLDYKRINLMRNVQVLCEEHNKQNFAEGHKGGLNKWSDISCPTLGRLNNAKVSIPPKLNL